MEQKEDVGRIREEAVKQLHELYSRMERALDRSMLKRGQGFTVWTATVAFVFYQRGIQAPQEDLLEDWMQRVMILAPVGFFWLQELMSDFSRTKNADQAKKLEKQLWCGQKISRGSLLLQSYNVDMEFLSKGRIICRSLMRPTILIFYAPLIWASFGILAILHDSNGWWCALVAAVIVTLALLVKGHLSKS